jgi:hypothetical protein
LALRLASEDFRVGFGGPTITGSSKDSVRVRFEGKTFNVSGYPDSIVVPADTVALPVTGILDGLPLIPLMAPQFTLGTVYGTNVTFRYLPTVEFTPEVGAFKFFGFGVQHNPQVWLGSPLPVDLCLSFFTQKLELGSLFEASTVAMGVNVSKKLGWRLLNVTPYGGFALEKSTMEFHYDLELETPSGLRTHPVSFELEGDNKTRITLGLSLRLLVFNLNADYNIARYPSMSFGLMLGI